MKEPTISIPLREYIYLLRKSSSQLVGFSAIDSEQRDKIVAIEGWQELCGLGVGVEGVWHLYNIDEFKAQENKRKAEKEYHNRRRELLLLFEAKLGAFLKVIAKGDIALATILQPMLIEEFLKQQPKLLIELGLMDSVGSVYEEYHQLKMV